jgi:hypothetical protein
MPRPLQPSSFNYQIPTLIQGVATSAPSSGSTGYVPGGALSLQIPDNTVMGGNPRGAGAIDLQVARTDATQVASGSNSVVLGSNSLAGGANSMALGYQAVANSSNSVAIHNSSTSSPNSFAAFTSNITRTDSNNCYVLFNSIARGSSDSSGSLVMASSNTGGAGSSPGTTNSFIAVNSSAPANAANNSVIIAGSTGYEGGTIVIGGSSCPLNHTGFSIGSSSSQSGGVSLKDSTTTGSNFPLTRPIAINNSTAASGGIALRSSTANTQGLAVSASTINASGAVAMMTAVSSQSARFVYAGNCVFSVAGDCQTSIFLSRASTTTNTAVVLTSDGAAAGTGNQLIASSNLAIAFTGELIGKQSGSANTVAYTIEGRLVNNAGTVTMPTGTLTLIGTDAIGLDTAPTLAADNTNKGLTVTSGAKTTTNIRWVCTLRTTEVLFA